MKNKRLCLYLIAASSLFGTVFHLIRERARHSALIQSDDVALLLSVAPESYNSKLFLLSVSVTNNSNSFLYIPKYTNSRLASGVFCWRDWNWEVFLVSGSERLWADQRVAKRHSEVNLQRIAPGETLSQQLDFTGWLNELNLADENLKESPQIVIRSRLLGGGERKIIRELGLPQRSNMVGELTSELSFTKELLESIISIQP